MDTQKHQSVIFAELSQGQDIMSRSDAFTQTMHPQERKLRLNIPEEISELEFLEYVSGQVREWTDSDREQLSKALEIFKKFLNISDLRFMEPVSLIKTTGKDEFNSPYTRQRAIILPASRLDRLNGPRDTLRLLLHEYFHILSRNHPDIRSALYTLLGFTWMDETGPAIPDTLLQQMITNPDAPHRNYYMTVTSGHGQIMMIPIIFLKAGLRTIDPGGDIARSIQIRLLPVEQNGKGWHVSTDSLDQIPAFVPDNGIVLNPVLSRDVPFFAEPEEIMAELFVAAIMNGNPGNGQLHGAVREILTH